MFSEPRVTSSDCFFTPQMSLDTRPVWQVKIWKGAVNSLSKHPWESSYIHAAPIFPPASRKRNEGWCKNTEEWIYCSCIFKFHFSDKSLKSDLPSSADLVDSGVFVDRVTVMTMFCLSAKVSTFIDNLVPFMLLQKCHFIQKWPPVGPGDSLHWKPNNLSLYTNQ